MFGITSRHLLFFVLMLIAWVLHIFSISCTTVSSCTRNDNTLKSHGLEICSWPFGCFFSAVLTLVILPWEGSNYPSRSCNGLHGPKGPKFKKKAWADRSGAATYHRRRSHTTPVPGDFTVECIASAPFFFQWGCISFAILETKGTVASICWCPDKRSYG